MLTARTIDAIFIAELLDVTLVPGGRVSTNVVDLVLVHLAATFAVQVTGDQMKRPELWGPLRSRYETPAPRKMLALDGGQHLGWAQPTRGFVARE